VPIFGAIALGFALAWPASILVAKWIKLEDPAWNEAKDTSRITGEARRPSGRDG
jgi:hypothetical protein